MTQPTRKTARTCAACGRTLKGKKLADAVYSTHTGSYYCGGREPCTSSRRRTRPPVEQTADAEAHVERETPDPDGPSPYIDGTDGFRLRDGTNLADRFPHAAAALWSTDDLAI